MSHSVSWRSGDRPKGFSTTTRAPALRAGRRQPVGDQGEGFGRDGQVVERILRGAQRRAQRRERLRVFVVALDVLQERGELLESCWVDASAMFLQALAGAFAQRLDAGRGSADADDGDVEAAAFDEGLERRKDLAIRQIPGRAEEHERVSVVHRAADRSSLPSRRRC
jgi:hypothetical protein